MKDLLPAVDAVCPGPAQTDSSVEVVVNTQSVTTVNSAALRAGNSRSSPSADHSEVAFASNKWGDSSPICRTSASSLKQNAESETPQHHVSNHLSLPGTMPPSENKATEVASPQNDSFIISPGPSFAPPLEPPPQTSSSLTPPVKTPPSPRRHSRIPSTGSRITVMEVSQSLNEVALSQDLLEPCTSPINGAQEPVSPVEITSNSRTTLSQIQAEKRKSSYEKYSAIILPPLKEEATPTQTPVGTLTRTNVNQRRPSIKVESQGDLNNEPSNDSIGSPVAAKTKDLVYLGK